MNKLKKAQSGKRTTRKKQKHVNKKTKRGGATSKKLRPLASPGPRLEMKSQNPGEENSSVNLSNSNRNSNSNSNSQDNSPSSSGRSGNKGETKIPPTTLYLGVAGLIVVGIAGIAGGVL